MPNNMLTTFVSTTLSGENLIKSIVLRVKEFDEFYEDGVVLWI